MSYNLRLSHNRNNVMGSFRLFDENENEIGRSVGYTITKRYITYQSSISETSFQILKRGRNRFVIFNEEEIFAAVRIYFLYEKVEIMLSDDTVFKFVSKDLGKTYDVSRNGENGKGRVHSPFWMEDDIEIQFNSISLFEVDCLVASIIAIGYSIDSSPISFFKEKKK